MSFKHNYKKLLQSGYLVTAGLLVGCGGGGGGGSDAPEVQNQAPSLTISGANRATEHQVASLKAEASDIDGSIASYAWSVDGIDLELTGANTSEVSFTAPSVEADTTFTVNLTVQDNDGASTSKSMLFTSERIFDTLTIQALATDDALVLPEVTIEIGDEAYTTTGTSEGYFIFRDIVFDERNFDKLVKITAVGNPQYNPGVKLVSLMESFNTLVSYETSQEYILALDYFALNVTNVTTAKYVLALAANGNQPIETEEQLNALYASLDNQKVLEVAGLLKVIIDNDEYALPETVSDTLSLVSAENSEVYQETLALINANYNLLNSAIEEILGDENLVQDPDFDADGIPDYLDPDIDNDGVINEDDYFDRDRNKSSPEIGMIHFPNDAQNGSWMEFCVRESINEKIRGEEYFNPYESYKKVSADDVTEIYCSGLSLSDLSTLKYFPNLKVLQLVETKVEDISILAQLTQLEELLISGVDVSDFSVIAQLTKLKILNIGQNNFSDLSLLANLVDLEVLNISDTYITDLADIGHLTKLKQLDVSGTEVSDLTIVENFTNLQWLLAHNAKVAKLADFSLLPQLTILTLYKNEIVDISPLASRISTTELDLSNNNITDISALANLVNLESLDLSFNQVNNLDALSLLTKLTTVDLSNNLLDSESQDIIAGTLLNGLANKTLLTELDLSKNQISSFNNDLDSLNQSVDLINLDVSYNNLQSIGPVNAFTLLENLDVSSNQIETIAEVQNLTALQRLDLADNNIEDISPLASLTALTQLLLNDNEISDVSVLNDWESLPQRLWLENNFRIDCTPTPVTEPVTEPSAIELLQIKANEQSIDFKGPCATFIERPAYEEPTQIDEILDVELTDYQTDGVSSLGDLDRIACMNQFHGGYPLCWVANVPSFYYPQCTAELNAPLMNCTDSPNTGSEYPFNSGNFWKPEPFSVDFDFSLQADNRFVSTFDNRLLITLLKSSNREVDINCGPLSQQSESTCTMTGDFFTGEISWTQDHSDENIPRCSGELGGTVATCTPGPSVTQIQDAAKTIDQHPVLNTDYNFEVDVSTFEITPAIDRDYQCIPGLNCW